MADAKRLVAGKLPAETTGFVGRRRFLAELKAAFANARLLTLVGPGGVGKTRLALRAAADFQRTVHDGAWFVDFAGLDDAHLVAKAVLTSLGLSDRSGQWPTSLLITHLASREALLVLDNCEHLLNTIAVLADVVLKEAPRVRLLATSRQPLGISGERVIQVPPLTLQSEGGGESGKRFADSEAASLLVMRARDAGVELEESDVTRQLVFDLCRRLDGMPLALELAAVRLRTIGLAELLERLTDRFAVLTGGSRTALPRQQTLKATIDWSYGLLSGQEAAVLNRLSAFPSDFGLDAAEAVATGTGMNGTLVLEAFSNLIEKSFVAKLGATASVRYRLHETMREYAVLKLREVGEQASVIKAFVRFYSGMCEKAEEAAQSSHAADWLKRLDTEADNLRAALAHCLDGPDHAIGLAMVASLLWYWTARASSEGAYWLGRFLDPPGEASLDLARALFARGFLAMTQGDAATAQRTLSEAEAKARTFGDLPLLARILATSAGVRAMSDDLAGGLAQLREAKGLAGGLQDAATDARVALTEGFFAFSNDDLEAAGRVYTEWAPRLRDRGDLQSLSYLLGNYSFTLLKNSQPNKARPLFEEALRIERQLENRDNILYLLDGLACEAATAGQFSRAARLLGAAQNLQNEESIRLMPHMAPLLRQAREATSVALAPATLQSETLAGGRMSRQEAIEYALEEKKAGGRAAPPMKAGPMPLSKREREVAGLISQGLSNKEIASRLFLSERTVETHVSNILNHLGVNTRVEIASWVARELTRA